MFPPRMKKIPLPSGVCIRQKYLWAKVYCTKYMGMKIKWNPSSWQNILNLNKIGLLFFLIFHLILESNHGLFKTKYVKPMAYTLGYKSCVCVFVS